MERSWAVAADRLTGDFDARRARGDRPLRRRAPARGRQSLDGPFSLSHHDFRADNLLIGGDRLVVLDWQTVGWGAPMFDVAYLLGTSVGPRDAAGARARRRSAAHVEELGVGWDRRRLGRVPPGVVGDAADARAADGQREGVRAHRPDVPAAPAPRRADGAGPRRRRSSCRDHRRRTTCRGTRVPDSPDAYERYFFFAAAPDGAPRGLGRRQRAPEQGPARRRVRDLRRRDPRERVRRRPPRRRPRLRADPARADRADARRCGSRSRAARTCASTRVSPPIEEERVTRRREGRVVQDRSRYAQLGTSTAPSTAARSTAGSPAATTRGASGTPPAARHSPSFFWLIGAFDDRAVQAVTHVDTDGRRYGEYAAVVRAGTAQEPRAVTDVDVEGPPHFTTARLTIGDETLELRSLHALLPRAVGYGHPIVGLGHAPPGAPARRHRAHRPRRRRPRRTASTTARCSSSASPVPTAPSATASSTNTGRSNVHRVRDVVREGRDRPQRLRVPERGRGRRQVARHPGGRDRVRDVRRRRLRRRSSSPAAARRRS